MHTDETYHLQCLGVQSDLYGRLTVEMRTHKTPTSQTIVGMGIRQASQHTVLEKRGEGKRREEKRRAQKRREEKREERREKRDERREKREERREVMGWDGKGREERRGEERRGEERGERREERGERREERGEVPVSFQQDLEPTPLPSHTRPPVYFPGTESTSVEWCHKQ